MAASLTLQRGRERAATLGGHLEDKPSQANLAGLGTPQTLFTTLLTLIFFSKSGFAPVSGAGVDPT